MYTLKKSLGQHFLKDENISRKIILSLSQCPLARLLEIGPGGGALTKFLLDMPQTEFKAVELDLEKIEFLLAQFPALRDKIIHEDFLNMSIPFNEKFSIVGNFPYNISTQILFKIIEWKEQVDCVVGMFQKEVAERIAAKEGSKIYGITSVLTQAFFRVTYLFEVSESSFNPPPKVKSAVIRLEPRIDLPAIRSEKDLFQLVKTAFNQRRKTLRNAVKQLFDENTLQDEMFGKRAEQLTVKEFADLSFRMKTVSAT